MKDITPNHRLKDKRENYNLKRRGRIDISIEFIKNEKYHELMYKLFSQFIPIHMIVELHKNTIVYYGYSKHFDLVNEWEEIQYTVIVENNKIIFNKAK